MAREVAFITGASRGIGAATARALAARGYDVAAAARTVKGGERFVYSPTVADARELALPGSLETTAAAVRERGREALVVRLDLLDRDSLCGAVDRTLADWGRIDVLVNNGIYQGPGLMDRFLDIPIDAVEKIFSGNVFSQLLLTQLVLRHMLERGSGTIVNMSSGSALMDPPAPTGEGGWGFAYGASKGAFHRMAGVLHVEHGSEGIRVFNVDPGNVHTESRDILPGGGSDLEERFPSAPPEVPAAAIAWLVCEPEADELRGQTVQAQRLCLKRGLVPGWPKAR